jgi:hypothetical protein
VHPSFALRALPVCAAVALLGGCNGGAQDPFLTSNHAVAPLQKHSAGLGKVLSTKNGGQIFGFDVDRNGNDGVLATAADVETFDQTTGKITAAFPATPPPGTSYAADGIFAGDVALITRFVQPKGKLFAQRHYALLNPVTAGKFTGKWTPPVRDVDVLQSGVNQSTSKAALFAIELKHQDRPDIIVTNLQPKAKSKVIHLDPNLFGLGNSPQFGQDSATNQAVIALSPDGGRVGGAPPINVLVNLRTGKTQQFIGLNGGPFGAGYVNGLAVDSTTGMAATTTELNAQVEFYDLAAQHGVATQLPCTGSASQSNSGAGIANDPENGLFLVTDPFYCDGSQGSAIVVYDEKGNVVETIAGFKFAIAEPAPAINPATRTGWAFGPGFNQLQQFFY